MAVYTRIPCPKCSQVLHLRLEYVNRRVVCNFCEHAFLSRTRLKIPAGAPPDVVQTIMEINREQGFPECEGGSTESMTAANPIELSGTQEFPRVELAGADEPVRPAAGDVLAGPVATDELQELRGEVESLLAQIEAARTQADASARLEADLRSARAECDQHRLTAKLLRADLAQRLPEIERLQARLADAEQVRTARENEFRTLQEQAEAHRQDAGRRAHERDQAAAARVRAEERVNELAGQLAQLAQERDEALEIAGRAQDLAGRLEQLERERDQAALAQTHAAGRVETMAGDLERLGEELERKSLECEEEREAHRRALQTARGEWEEKLRAAHASRTAETAATLLAHRAEVDEHRQKADRLRQERDAALRLVEDFYQEQRSLADQVATMEAENDRIDDERQAAVAEVEQLRARVDEQERALAEAHTAQLLEAQRAAEAREPTANQIGAALSQLDDALAQLDQARVQLEADRQAMKGEAERRREHIEKLVRTQLEAAFDQERAQFRGEVEGLKTELEQLLRQKEAETQRGGTLVEQVQRLEAEIVQQRQEREAELHARDITIEELRLLLKSWQRFEPFPIEGPLALDGLVDPAALGALPAPAAAVAEPLEPVLALEDGRAEALAVPIDEAPVIADAPAPDESDAERVTPLDVAFGPNAPESPDERIAALRVYLKKIHEAEEERINKRLLRRLTRAWRSADSG